MERTKERYPSVRPYLAHALIATTMVVLVPLLVTVGMNVGRGAWAGPISVGAVVLPADKRVYRVRDSKMLTEVERERLFDRVASWCRAWAGTSS